MAGLERFHFNVVDERPAPRGAALRADELYRGLLAHGPAQALRQASMVALQGSAAIRDWAGFVLVGGGRPFQEATKGVS